MTKWWHVSWKRVGIGFLIAYAGLSAVAGAGILAFDQLAPWLTARTLFGDDPHMSLVPVALLDKSLATLSGVRVEKYGFSLQTPWKEITHDKSERGVYPVSFMNDGAGMMLFDPSGSLDSAASMREIAKTRGILDTSTPHSNARLMGEAIAATPEDVAWWKPPSRNARSLALLEIKTLTLRNFGALYTVASGEMHGYQEGNPSIAPYRVQLNLFDSSDRHYEIWITSKVGQGPAFSQAEVNAMVASFKPIAHN